MTWDGIERRDTGSLDVSFKHYFDERHADLEKYLVALLHERDARIQLALNAAKEAVDKAELANERRLTLLNEFRGQVNDQAARFALTEVMDERFTGFERRVDRNENAIANLQGRALALAGFGAVLGGAIAAFMVKAIGG